MPRPKQEKRLDRHPGSGVPITCKPRKGGAGGKGAWGKPTDQTPIYLLDNHDPNYDSQQEEVTFTAHEGDFDFQDVFEENGVRDVGAASDHDDLHSEDGRSICSRTTSLQISSEASENGTETAKNEGLDDLQCLIVACPLQETPIEDILLEQPKLKTSVDDFELMAVVGRGGFGKVLQVRKKDTRQIYAMKIMRKEHIIRKNNVGYTKSERNILKNVTHPFIADLHWAFQTTEKLYLVTRFCSGGELFHHLRKEHMFSEELVRFYASEIVLAIGHIHSLNIVHRDLKPENILLDADGHLCLADFGLAKSEVATHDTGARSFVGTDEYMAPEIILGTGHGKAVDWWSLGALIYEMLSGRPPFEMKNRNIKKLHKDILDARLKIPPFLSNEARSLIKALLHRTPEKRLGSGLADVEEVKSHAFFRAVNWNRVYKKESVPPFKPDVPLRDSDISNFSVQFTKEMPVDSPVDAKAVPNGHHANVFGSFTYVAPSYLEIAMRPARVDA